MMSVHSKDQRRAWNGYQRMPNNDIRSSYVGLICGTRVKGLLKAMSHDECRISLRMRNECHFFWIRWNAIHVRIIFLNGRSSSGDVRCLYALFFPLSKSFVSDTLKTTRSSYVGFCGTRLTGPLKALSHECRIVPHRPTHEKRMTFNAWKANDVDKVTRTNNAKLPTDERPVKGSKGHETHFWQTSTDAAL